MGDVILRVLIVIGFVSVCEAAPAPRDKPVVFETSSLPELAGSFDQFFRQELAKANVPGGAYAIVQGDRIISIHGYGVREQGGTEPVDEHTVFRLASVSKTFAAGLSAKLVEEHKFSLDDRLVSYVPEFRFKTDHKADRLQLGHLLSHSAGVMPNAYDNMLEANVPLPRIITSFKKVDPLCDPGECYGYQNVLYAMIGPVMEQTTLRTYENLISDMIFKPLEMSNASVGYQAFLHSENRAAPHVRTRKGWLKTKVKPAYYEVLPAAGVNASVSDMAQWLIAQMGHRPEVMSAGVLDSLTEKKIRTKKELRRRDWRNYLKDAYYGLGWRIYQFGKEQLIYHGGWVAGFRADVAYSKSRDVGIVILLNAESNVINRLSTRFWAEIMKSAI
ncbi:serine hydrolase domain-containing protein [Emcibacter sp.]|uniref:serine hydrolase domain-containing protein n=1 Tax=Emcibacter sp. TaxID=1979954 RepID=UPI002AA625DC|nr:serine hydrolase domain-containing protein [Emcibacter sp.]